MGLHDDQAFSRTRDERRGHILTATMYNKRLREQTIIIRNMSSRGIGARTRDILPMEGEEVFVLLDGHELVGRVRWVQGDRFGIYLRDPIDRPDQRKSPWPSRDMVKARFQVPDRFKPVEKAWRPSVSGRLKNPN